jgi:hypothetical protein
LTQLLDRHKNADTDEEKQRLAGLIQKLQEKIGA